MDDERQAGKEDVSEVSLSEDEEGESAVSEARDQTTLQDGLVEMVETVRGQDAHGVRW